MMDELLHTEVFNLIPHESEGKRSNVQQLQPISNQDLKVAVWNKSGFLGRLMLLLTDNKPRTIDGC